MTGFILFALVLITLAVLIVVPVLLRKNHPIDDEYDGFNVAIAKDRLKEIKQQRETGEISEESYQQLHNELEAALAIDLAVDPANTQQNNSQGTDDLSAGKKKLSAIVVALSIPVISAGVYSQLGDFDAATGQPVVQAQFAQPAPATNAAGAPQMGGAGGEKSELTMEEAAAALEKRLLASPGNPEGWFMLARTYMVMKKYHKAKAAYEKTIELAGENPDILLRYVDAVAMTEGGSLSGAAKPILEKVIRQLPNSPMALWLAGTAESQQGNYKKALTHWYKLRPLLNGSVNDQAELNKLINGAESNFTPVELAELKKTLAVVEVQPVRMPTARPAAPGDTAKTASASTGGAEIRVIVDLDPTLKDKVSPSDTLFVFAKALQGPPMPLAAVKKTVADLPLTITLNDAMAMMPQMKLSNFENVKVSAVVSKSGQPGAKQGDLFVEVFPVKVAAAEEIILLINQVK